MSLDPFRNPFGFSSGPNLNEIFVRSRGAGGGVSRRPKPKPQETSEEAEALGPEAYAEETASEPPSPPAEEAVLSDPAWVNEKTQFHEEAGVSVKLALPKGKENLTRIELELFAKGSTDPNPIAKVQAHAKADGTAVFTVPIYRPKDQEEGPVEYFLAFKHALAKVLKPEALLRQVTEMALKSAEHALVPGVAFNKETSFIGPKGAAGFKTLDKTFSDWKTKYPKAQIVIYGHSDPEERDAKSLSERRAQSAYAFIINDAGAWEKLYLQEKWGLARLQLLLKDLGFYPGTVDGKDGPQTQAAFKALQRKSSLPESGKEDAATRKALFSAYMKGKHDIRIEASRFRKVAGNPWMGCGALNAAKEGMGMAENRRVAFLLLNESKVFPIHFYCQDGNDSACRRQCQRSGTRSMPGNQCLFYDQLVREDKQDPGAEEDEVPVDSSAKIPWMDIAEGEAKRWKGKTEAEIGKTINYHQEVGIKLSDLSGTDHAWCASFVNYCLKQAGYAMTANPCRARAISGDSNFDEIDKPVYGAIALIGTHHIGFVSGKDSTSKKSILLGGNQSDQINFTVFKESTRYFLPKAFDQAKHTGMTLEETTAKALNERFGIVRHSKTGDATR